MAEPQPSPSAAFEVANRHQEKYEAIVRETRPFNLMTPRDQKFHHLAMVENNALLAIAGFLEQMSVCGHGVRGWCPSCQMSIQNGVMP